ncbi:MAG: hypothetical protein ACREFT_08215, partial [Acetobacteraceae bacterium]
MFGKMGSGARREKANARSGRGKTGKIRVRGEIRARKTRAEQQLGGQIPWPMEQGILAGYQGN